MTTRVNARLRPQVAAKIARLRKATGETTSDIVNRAIETLHDSLLNEGTDALFSTFIGSGQADATLSEDYKTEMAKSFANKT